MKGFKHDEGKPQFHLLKNEALLEVVKVLTYGAKKYSPDNWKMLENSQQRYFDAANRHMWQWHKGEQNDEESGYHHLAHAISSLMFIMQIDLEGELSKRKERDDLLRSVLGPPEPHGY